MKERETGFEKGRCILGNRCALQGCIDTSSHPPANPTRPPPPVSWAIPCGCSVARLGVGCCKAWQGRASGQAPVLAPRRRWRGMMQSYQLRGTARPYRITAIRTAQGRKRASMSCLMTCTVADLLVFLANLAVMSVACHSQRPRIVVRAWANDTAPMR
jgi:hypothetical protein